jgi:hypothetical protein
MDPPKVQKYVIVPQIMKVCYFQDQVLQQRTNIFGKIWTAHRSLGFLGISSRRQIPRFHTPKSKQGLEVNLDEHKRVATMFQHVTKYYVQMTNIRLRFSDLEIISEQIIEQNNKSIQNLQGTLAKEQKLKIKL